MYKSFPPMTRVSSVAGWLLALVVGCGDMRMMDTSRSSSWHRSQASPVAARASNEPGTAGAAGTATTLPDSGVDTDASVTKTVVDRAILVSVDGLGARYLAGPIAGGTLSGFTALMQAGSSTLNARADYEFTITLPNHTSMLTGRPVARDPELPADVHHGWTANWLVEPNVTIHNSGNPALSYISSVFDVAHDHGKRTCMYAGKAKFMVYANSYNSMNGADDDTGVNNGRNKLDRVVILENATDQLISIAEADIKGNLCDLAFIHIADLDTPIGHSVGWGTNDWYEGLSRVDAWLARLLRLTTQSDLGTTVGLVVTADHGGNEQDHSDSMNVWNYQIPFFAVGPGFTPKRDLYSIANGSRRDPGTERPRYVAERQPVRNADAANVLMTMLGLPLVPGSFMHDLLPSN